MNFDIIIIEWTRWLCNIRASRLVLVAIIEKEVWAVYALTGDVSTKIFLKASMLIVNPLNTTVLIKNAKMISNHISEVED